MPKITMILILSAVLWAILILLLVILLNGCAIVPTEHGRAVTAGHMVILDVGENWHRTSIVPMALDDSVHIVNTADGGVEVEKTAGEGKKINLFDAALGGLFGLFGGLAL